MKVVLSREELGSLIKKARKLKKQVTGINYTQEMLANDIGVSRGYLGDIETGRAYPNYVLINKIALACDVPLSFFSDIEQKIDSCVQEQLADYDYKTQKMIIDAIKLSDDVRLDFLSGSDKDKISLHGYKTKTDESTKASNEIPFKPDSIIMVPVYGRIAAGLPITAIQENDEYYPLDTSLFNVNSGHTPSDFFYLHVKGDSMEPTILDGDLVLIRRQNTVETNEVAAVLCNGEDATIKRVTISDDKLILNPDNKAYPPQLYNACDCHIIGKVLKRVGDVR